MAVDFMPSRGDYTDLRPFRFWCQKVLPLVYDDALSYYELLCKVVDYLNKAMEDVGVLDEDVGAMYTAFGQLQNTFNTLQQYVDDYFTNLDVQEEIDNKLDEMASDGTLVTILTPVITTVSTQVVTDWLEDNITPTSPPVDATLTISGAAADAKVTGDEIAKIKTDLSAVADINLPDDLRTHSYEQGYLIDDGVFVPTSGTNAQKTTTPIHLESGTYNITFDGYNNDTHVTAVRAVAVYNSANVCTSYTQTADLTSFVVGANDSYVRINVAYTSVNEYSIMKSSLYPVMIKEDVKIPTDTTLTISGKPADSKATGDAIDVVDQKANTTISNLDSIATFPFEQDISSYPYEQGYLDANGEFVATSGNNRQKTTLAIPLEPGDYEVIFSGLDASTEVSYVRAIAVYNSSDVCTNYQQTVDLKNFTVTENDSYVRINVSYSSVETYIIRSLEEAKIKQVAIPNILLESYNYMPYRRPVIAFIFDGEYNRNPSFKTLFDEHDLKCGFALPYNTTFPYTNKNTYIKWEDEGFEILSHSAVAVGTQSSATDDEIAQIVKDSYETLVGYGFHIHGFIAYQGNAKPIAISTAQQLFDYAATVTNHAGNLTGNLAESCIYFNTDSPYTLWRYSMQASTLQQMKDAVDRCKDTNGLVLFYGHANSTQLNNMTIENIDELLTYINSKDIEIKLPYDAIRDYYSIRYQDII